MRRYVFIPPLFRGTEQYGLFLSLLTILHDKASQEEDRGKPPVLSPGKQNSVLMSPGGEVVIALVT